VFFKTIKVKKTKKQKKTKKTIKVKLNKETMQFSFLVPISALSKSQ
jgi:hypothetical protein